MKLIIFDLDETLIHCCNEWIGRKPDFLAGNQMIFVRPFAKELVAELSPTNKIAVWTASYGKYLSDIIEHLFPEQGMLEFIWDRNQCLLVDNRNEPPYFIKDLKQVCNAGWFEKDFLIVDDKPEHITGNPKNIISIKPFFGSVDDIALKNLLNSIQRFEQSS